jgi:diaminopimelate epimerase
MGQISFIKMSGAGNDFIIIDSRKDIHQFTSKQIAKISKRNNIGCDQFIILKNSSKAQIFMDIYNSDGSLSDACGNATRCVASLIMAEVGLDRISIETNAGILPCSRNDESILVNMGLPKFSANEIPLSKEMDSALIKINNFEFSAVNMGNPHIVTFLDNELSDSKFFELGPKFEIHDYFPQKTNVEFVTIINPNHLKVRVWERGVGETLSCGSGACAVGVIAFKKGLVKDEEVKISFKGGDIFISLNKAGEVIMRGQVLTIFYGIIDENFLN